MAAAAETTGEERPKALLRREDGGWESLRCNTPVGAIIAGDKKPYAADRLRWKCLCRMLSAVQFLLAPAMICGIAKFR